MKECTSCPRNTVFDSSKNNHFFGHPAFIWGCEWVEEVKQQCNNAFSILKLILQRKIGINIRKSSYLLGDKQRVQEISNNHKKYRSNIFGSVPFQCSKSSLLEALCGGPQVHIKVGELVDLLVPVHPWLSSGTSMQAPPVLMECLVPESSSISRISTLYYHHQYQRKLCTNAPAAAPVSGPV